MKPKHDIVMLAVALVFTSPSSGWAGAKYKVLHNFGAPNDGDDPAGAPLLDGKGNLYGATSGGPQVRPVGAQEVYSARSVLDV